MMRVCFFCVSLILLAAPLRAEETRTPAVNRLGSWLGALQIKQKDGTTKGFADVAAEAAFKLYLDRLKPHVLVSYDVLKTDVAAGQMSLEGVKVDSRYKKRSSAITVENLTLVGVDVVAFLKGEAVSVEQVTLGGGVFTYRESKEGQPDHKVAGQVSEITVENARFITRQMSYLFDEVAIDAFAVAETIGEEKKTYRAQDLAASFLVVPARVQGTAEEILSAVTVAELSLGGRAIDDPVDLLPLLLQ